MPPPDAIRQLFDLPPEVAYLACASQAPLAKAVHTAGVAGLERKLHPWTAHAMPDLGAVAERCRGLFAGLIGATAEDIAIVPATSYGVATAAANLPLAKSQAVLVLEQQFPSDYYAWQVKAAEAGAALKVVPRPADGDWTAAVLAALTPEVAIAAVPPCHWVDGAAIDLVAVGGACRRIGAALSVDATQLIAAAPFDVAAVQPDFLQCSGYKWLLCPYTLSFLYVAPHRQEGRPLEEHAGGRFGWEGYHDRYAPGARRFDMGERLAHAHLPMAEAGLTMVSGWGPTAVAAGLKPLVERVAALASERGWRVPPAAHRVGHYLGISRPVPFPPDVEARLRRHDIHVSLREGGVRVAPYLFSTAAEVDRLFAALDKIP
ncbi:MAG TPA: aminotransferase class V-fold PLP-dependent enzyme [Kiloniellales bacterium]|nr:aminotransferase class V-fold PLP-dependent enzyme [Kiloniellales bacterium]